MIMTKFCHREASIAYPNIHLHFAPKTEQREKLS